jgi:hypothetical protein
MWWSLAVLSFGCGQSYEAGVEALCNAPVTCTTCVEADAADKAVRLADHVRSTVHNPEVLSMFESFSSLSPEEKVSALGHAAARARISGCAMQDLWRAVAPAQP